MILGDRIDDKRRMADVQRVAHAAQRRAREDLLQAAGVAGERLTVQGGVEPAGRDSVAPVIWWHM
jgi:hypothetical protein